MIGSRLGDEAGRLAALRRYEVLDTAPEAAFDRITALVRDVFDVPMAAVSLVDRDRQWFKSRDGFDLSQTTRDISFCTHMIATREPMVIVDARHDSRFEANPLVVGPPHIVSYAGAPLVTRDGYHIGSLCALDHKPRDFSLAQIDLLVKFSGLVVDEFELREIATHDDLTGARSRRALLGEAARTIARRERDKQAATLILFDIDHFKTINDLYGHPAGDLVLAQIAVICGAMLRPNDVLGRVGGEEFALVLPGVDGAAAMAVAERCRKAIAGLAFAFDPALRVTASFGVAPLTMAITSPEAWLAAADVPMFAAKHGGRNRCELAGLPD